MRGQSLRRESGSRIICQLVKCCSFPHLGIVENLEDENTCWKWDSGKTSSKLCSCVLHLLGDPEALVSSHSEAGTVLEIVPS